MHLAAAAGAAGIRVDAPTRAECDVCDPSAVAAAVRGAKPAFIVNFSGLASVPASWERPREAFEVNAAGSLNVVRAAAAEAPGAPVLLASSAEVYGRPQGSVPLGEDSPAAPLTPYGASKAAMEVLCRREASSKGIALVVIRSFNQIGPGQPGSYAASGFARQIAVAEAAGRDRVSLRVGNLASLRDFTDARDAARAAVLLLEAGAEGTFNLCSERLVAIGELADGLRGETKLVVETKLDPDLARAVDPPAPRGSARRLRELTGWQPEIPLERSVGDLLDWWRERTPHL